MPLLKFKRGTRAQLNAAASGSLLNLGEPYLITDEGRLAVGTDVNKFSAVALESHSHPYTGLTPDLVPKAGIALEGVVGALVNSKLSDDGTTPKYDGTALSLDGHTHTGLLSGLTSGRVPYATGAAALGDSPVYTDGTNVGTRPYGTALYGQFVIGNGAGPGLEISPGVTTAGMTDGVFITSINRSGTVPLDTYFSTSNVMFKATGNVGIGTPTPQSRLDIADGALEMAEMTAPAAPAANGARLYLEDNGAGKTRLCVKFASGAAIVLATEV